MSKLIPKHTFKKLSIALFALFVCINTNAQEETVIDNKGNIITVRNNVVTISSSAPVSPVEGDVWFDNTDPNNRVTSVWDGTAWQEIIHEGTSGSLFFGAVDGRPTEDNAQLFWDDTNDRLGIGTNSPTEKLEVVGTTSTQGVLNSNGTLAEPAYRFSGDTDTGIFTPAADVLGFSVGGLLALRINEASSSTTVTVDETLELDGQVLDESDSAGTTGQILTATTTGTAWANQPIKAFGKISAAGAVVRATSGVTSTRTSTGRYRVTLTGVVTDGDYIIQLTQPGRGGTGLIGGGGNDDPGISYANQDATGFDVIIGDNDNGGTDRARFNSEFMFTVLDL